MRPSDAVQSRVLLAVVFVTGACVLIMEILSTRLLSSFFGNTIYSVSSIIGVTLAALSIGYALGGRIADKWPSAAVFFGIILGSGMTMFAAKFLSRTLLPFAAPLFSIATGPAVFSALLFGIPSVLLGTLSPFAIRLLQTSDKRGVGSLSGDVFFWSTIGSIAGTFLAGFVLIPRLGVQNILLLLGCVLLLIGGAGLLLSARRKRVTVIILLVTLLFAAAEIVFVRPDDTGIVLRNEGLYHMLLVQDIDFLGRTARFLFEDHYPSSAIFLDTGEPAFAYVKFLEFAFALEPEIRRALVIGAGAYTIPHALVQNPDLSVDVVDIEPKLRAVAREYFGVEENPRLRTVIEDGRRFLGQRGTTYDLIVGDAFQNMYAIPPHLATREFFTLARSRLSADGIFLMNLNAMLSSDSPSLLWSAMRTFRSVFPHSSFFAVESLSADKSQNVIFLGCNDSSCDDPCKSIPAARLSAFLKDACSRQISLDAVDFTRFELLTDDYAPVETLSPRP